MQTLILYDRESKSYNGIDLSALVETVVQKTGGEPKAILLNGDEIKPCIGCYNCWVKTPGLCAITADCANTVSKQVINSGTLILLSKITFGGYSYDIKSFIDRSIPNSSPFFEIIKGEMRHPMRYESFPSLISIGYGVCTPQELQTFISLTKRNALNMRPPRQFVFTIQDPDRIDETMQSLENVLLQEVLI